jgi:hypothetical protein
MTQANDLNHLINELSVADQVLKTVDKAQRPDPVVEKVVVEKIVNVEKPTAVPSEVKQQTSDDLLVFSVFFSFFGFELSLLAVTGVILVMI